MRVGNSVGSRAWRGLLGRRSDWESACPGAMGVRNGLSGQWASLGTGPGSSRSVSRLGGCERTSGGGSVSSSHKDDLDEELEVGVVLRQGDGLHRLAYLMVFSRRPTGIASVFSDVGLTTWRSRGPQLAWMSPLQSGSWRRSCRP